MFQEGDLILYKVQPNNQEVGEEKIGHNQEGSYHKSAFLIMGHNT